MLTKNIKDFQNFYNHFWKKWKFKMKSRDWKTFFFINLTENYKKLCFWGPVT